MESDLVAGRCTWSPRVPAVPKPLLAAALAATIAVSAFFFLPTTQASAFSAGVSGWAWNTHVWFIATDRELLQFGVKQAMQRACEAREPGLGAACGYLIDQLFKRIDTRGWTNHGVWGELYPFPQRIRLGRW